MTEVDPDYEERFSHATVSRWESGATRPSASRLLVFGKALNLYESEVAGLILLSGVAPDFNAAKERANRPDDDQAVRHPGFAEDVEHGVDQGSSTDHGIWSRSSLVNQTARFLMLRTLPLAIGIVVVGYALALLGWDAAWTPVAYVGIALVLVLGQGFCFRTRTPAFGSFSGLRCLSS